MVDKITIDGMSEHYRNIRRLVYIEATRPFSNDPLIHELNKDKLKGKIQRICYEANLDLYRGSDRDTAVAIWHHLWTKIRYAYIKANVATKEIIDIEDIFDNFEFFSNASWDIVAQGHNVISSGEQVNNFCQRKGVFSNKQTVGNIQKLKKTVDLARIFYKFFNSKKVDTPILNFIKNGYMEDDVWSIHKHLIDMGYRGDLTALHLMMDLGFQVIKPDIVISKLFLDWGWLNKIMSNIPQDLSLEDLKGKGNYGKNFLYTKSKMYKPIIDLARKIVSFTKKDDLISDIGWATDNSIREFDIFLVKYGQKPEQGWGIERTLYETNTISDFCSSR